MTKTSLMTLAVLCLVGGAANAKSPADHTQAAGRAFDHDARKFGNSVQSVSGKVKNDIASGAVQMVTGPTGDAIMVVGDVTLDAANAAAGAYNTAGGGLKCLAGDPLNPFKDGGCVVQMGGKTLVLGVETLKNGSNTLIIASADILGEAFDGFSRIMRSTAHATGDMRTPVGAFFLLAYHVTNAGESVIHFALVDVVDRSVLILADEGTTIVEAPVSALYDIVTLKWKRAGVKLINLPVRIINSLINIPARLIFGHKANNITLRLLSPLGHLIDRKLGLNAEHVRDLEASK